MQEMDMEEIEARLYGQVFHSAPLESVLPSASVLSIGQPPEKGPNLNYRHVSNFSINNMAPQKSRYWKSQPHLQVVINNDIVPFTNDPQDKQTVIINNTAPFNFLQSFEELIKQRKRDKKQRRKIKKLKKANDALNNKQKLNQDEMQPFHAVTRFNTQTESAIVISDSDSDSDVQILEPGKKPVYLVESDPEVAPDDKQLAQPHHTPTQTETEAEVSNEDNFLNDTLVLETSDNSTLPLETNTTDDACNDLTDDVPCINKTSEISCTPDSTNDFIDSDIQKESQCQFNFSLHGSDLDLSGKFSSEVRNTQVDLFETGSSCSGVTTPTKISYSKITSSDTPKDIFCEEDLASFSNFITPKRDDKKRKSCENAESQPTKTPKLAEKQPTETLKLAENQPTKTLKLAEKQSTITPKLAEKAEKVVKTGKKNKKKTNSDTNTNQILSSMLKRRRQLKKWHAKTISQVKKYKRLSKTDDSKAEIYQQQLKLLSKRTQLLKDIELDISNLKKIINVSCESNIEPNKTHQSNEKNSTETTCKNIEEIELPNEKTRLENFKTILEAKVEHLKTHPKLFRRTDKKINTLQTCINSLIKNLNKIDTDTNKDTAGLQEIHNDYIIDINTITNKVLIKLVKRHTEWYQNVENARQKLLYHGFNPKSASLNDQVRNRTSLVKVFNQDCGQLSSVENEIRSHLSNTSTYSVYHKSFLDYWTDKYNETMCQIKLLNEEKVAVDRRKGLNRKEQVNLYLEDIKKSKKYIKFIEKRIQFWNTEQKDTVSKKNKSPVNKSIQNDIPDENTQSNDKNTNQNESKEKEIQENETEGETKASEETIEKENLVILSPRTINNTISIANPPTIESNPACDPEQELKESDQELKESADSECECECEEVQIKTEDQVIVVEDSEDETQTEKCDSPSEVTLNRSNEKLSELLELYKDIPSEEDASSSDCESNITLNITPSKSQSGGHQLVENPFTGSPLQHNNDQLVENPFYIKKKNFSDFWTENMDDFYNKSWGQENFDLNSTLNSMPADPNKWKIIDDDKNIFKKPKKRKFCTFCRRDGHINYDCPKLNNKEAVRCSLCGDENHLKSRCPNVMCLTCGHRGGFLTTSCRNCFHFKRIRCKVCNVMGHPDDLCPDLWRRYHLSTNENEDPVSMSAKLKPSREQWCSGCARRGHLYHECRRIIREHNPTLPYIVSYERTYGRMVSEDNHDRSPEPPGSRPSEARVRGSEGPRGRARGLAGPQAMMLRRLRQECVLGKEHYLPQLRHLELGLRKGNISIAEIYRLKNLIRNHDY